MTIDEAFAAVGHTFPRPAAWQGIHFHYAANNKGSLIERKKTVFTTDDRCAHCGSHTGEKESRFFYWLLVDGIYELVHASRSSKFHSMQTVGDSFEPTDAYTPSPTTRR